MTDDKPRLIVLDLMCGAGGCTKGYQEAGFYVVGVDIELQPNYCGDEFVQADALEVLRILLAGEEWNGYVLEDFAAIHASPPCQRWTKMQRQRKNHDAHPDLLTPARELLVAADLPWVIENVEGAPLRNPVLLCGSMFDPPLEIRRHRLFEANWPLPHPVWPCRHSLWGKRRHPGTPNGSGERPGSAVVNPFASGTSHELFSAAMGIDWIPAPGFRPHRDLYEAIPPAYTEYIGNHLLAHIEAEARDTAAA